MSNELKLPDKKAAIYWPVGTGDSTTLILKPGNMVMQIDIRHLEKADDPDEAEWSIIDHLVKILPKRNGRPYLSAFVLTHPDKDHVQGFAELLKRVDIGELWHTPNIFRDQSDQETLCEDAKAFRKEANRRRETILNAKGVVKSGDLLRVIGYDDILSEEKYKDLPAVCKSIPGDTVRVVDGTDISDDFCAFIHAPFKDDQAKNRNNTSLALNIALFESGKCAQFFFFGDREYPTIKRIFETTEKNEKNKAYLYWDAMLCPHHCSKAVMYWQDEGEVDEALKQDIMDYFEKYRRTESSVIVASAHSDFSNEDGKNPPHKKARDQYEKVVGAGKFVCTHEYPNVKSPEPLVLTIDSSGFGFDDKRKKGQGPSGLASLVATARPGNEPPRVQVGFGKR